MCSLAVTGATRIENPRVVSASTLAGHDSLGLGSVLACSKHDCRNHDGFYDGSRPGASKVVGDSYRPEEKETSLLAAIYAGCSNCAGSG